MQRVACENCGSRMLTSTAPRHCPTCGKRTGWRSLQIEGVPEALTQPATPVGVAAAGARPGVVTFAAVALFINAGVRLLIFVLLLSFAFGFMTSAGAMGPAFVPGFAGAFLSFLLVLAFGIWGIPAVAALLGGIFSLKGRGWGRILGIVMGSIFALTELSGLSMGLLDPTILLWGGGFLALDIACVVCLSLPSAGAWFHAVAAAREDEAVARRAAVEAAVAAAAEPAPKPVGGRYAPRPAA